MANIKKSVKKTISKKCECPCGCCGDESMKYTSVLEAWRAFWRRGFSEWAGTSSRSEYWLSWVGNIIVFIIGGAIVALLAVAEQWMFGHPAVLSKIAASVLVLYGVACIIPAISMMTRRMHDAGLSAWLWVIYAFGVVPTYMFDGLTFGTGIGLIVALLPTQKHDNKYQKYNK